MSNSTKPAIMTFHSSLSKRVTAALAGRFIIRIRKVLRPSFVIVFINWVSFGSVNNPKAQTSIVRIVLGFALQSVKKCGTEYRRKFEKIGSCAELLGSIWTLIYLQIGGEVSGRAK